MTSPVRPSSPPMNLAREGEDDRLREITLLTNLLVMEEQRNEEYKARLRWSSAVHEHLLQTSRWWALLSPVKRRRRQLEILKAAGLFDHEAYLRRYPDVVASGIDPLSHYLSHGLSEGRSGASDKLPADRG